MHASSLDLSDAVSGKLVKSIMSEIKKTDEVLKVKELRARRVGQMTYVDVVIAVFPYVQVVDADKVASKVEANLTKLLGPSSIMIHIEPLEWKIPVELQIKNATQRVNGVRGVHNVSAAEVEGKLYVVLHVQVDAKLALDDAHEIAKFIERAIQDSVSNVNQVIVHLEPSVPENTSGTMIVEKTISEAVRTVIEDQSNSVATSIVIYSTKEGMRINVRCRFKGEYSISKVHELMSKIENAVRSKFKDAIVTIQPEPTNINQKQK
jgi:divalent metal cation (Fe/Co/Zn/Cd) transporter